MQSVIRKILLQGCTKIANKNGTELKDWCEINICYNDQNLYGPMNSPATVLDSVYLATKNGTRAAFDGNACERNRVCSSSGREVQNKVGQSSGIETLVATFSR